MNKLQTGICFALLALSVVLAGCSSGPKVQEFATTANASDEVQRLGADMQTATERQVNVLSPAAFRQADRAWKSAVVGQQKGDDAKDVLHSVAQARAQLDRANQFAELSRTNMEEVVAARQAAIAAGAPKLFAQDFKEADEHLRSVTSDVEANDLSGVAENRGKLQKAFLDVELKAIKQANVGPARATIAQAVQEGAREYAKQSLAIAEKSANDAEAFIMANPHATDALKARSDDASKTATHLLKITRASKAGENVSSEQAALRLESEQAKTQEQRMQLSHERKSAKQLALETGDLKSTKAFNESFEAARGEFTTSEAEIYRQGNRLVIRLRALEFPANQSVLRGSNLPLLAKVAKVVKGFTNPRVVVEGHTDSDGGKVQNTRLSTERAQVVSDYLVSSEAIEQNHISVAGYGFERPLATNKTKQGKAQNRRVDVVITPQGE